MLRVPFAEMTIDGRPSTAVHKQMGGKKCEGITACSVISLGTKHEFANTGSAFVWEMFDSIA